MTGGRNRPPAQAWQDYLQAAQALDVRCRAAPTPSELPQARDPEPENSPRAPRPDSRPRRWPGWRPAATRALRRGARLIRMLRLR